MDPELQTSFFWWFLVTSRELVPVKQDSGPDLDSYV